MTAASIGLPASAQSRRAVTAAVIGNVLEWYDFAVYGYVAAIIGKNFFPGTDETTELLKAFLTFGLGFVARPIGGIVIGRIKVDELAHYRSRTELDVMRSLKRALDPQNIMNPGKVIRI